ncbi:ComF family protein [Limnoraphis robusta]|uniref:Phosphoribosyltransferase n=1 Tax=Limnoraphis robusta CS-951 TaxID=1637645 RepID=A0A0F5YCH6_9CYAN|nr:ComF family protein [Limnoraphis robusta]KKD35945.1 phosphoribosyltransferase [Limnoraphis robusta CS-951]
MMGNFIKTILNLFFKPDCPLCDRPAEKQLCLYCQKQILRCQFPRGSLFLGDVPVLIWGQYKGMLKQAIVTLKYNNHPEIAQPLGYWLADAWLKTPTVQNKPLLVVPIPMFPEKQKKRGFNQAELLARSFCQVTGLPLKSQGLERVRDTQAQFGLSAQQRQENLKDAFCLGKDLRRPTQTHSILIVDDIYTTGATVKAAIAAFREHKIAVAGVVAIATTKSLSEQ